MNDPLQQGNWLKRASEPGTADNVLGRIGGWLREKGIPEVVQLVQELLDLLRCPEISLMYKTMVVAALLYLMTPLDAVPDFLPVVGWLDDIAILTATLAMIKAKLAEVRECCSRQGYSCDRCPRR